MLFSAKSKGFFVEQNEHATLIARTSAPAGQMVVEELRECPPGDSSALTAALRELQQKKSSGYVHATCGVCPTNRLVRRVALDLKRVKEPEYLNEVVSSQFRVEPNRFTLALLNAGDGVDYDFNKAAQKEVIICGLPSDEVIATQDALLASGIYPDQLELTTVGMLGALADYLAFTKSKTPVLVLELGAETTHSFIVTAGGLDTARPIPQGLEAMIPVVQKELGLRDEESARKLFYSNTFDFTGMGGALIKKLVKELQSSIGFYEVQTGQSIGQVLCTQVPPKMNWVDGAIAGLLGVTGLQPDLHPWLQARGITLSEEAAVAGQDLRWLGLLGLIVHHNNAPA
ncbi:MAG TPA: hypothetical protein VNW23_00660 [Opitutaceae bacterium]|nr:hypothetical protein [Opitutaceae bacterium]